MVIFQSPLEIVIFLDCQNHRFYLVNILLQVTCYMTMPTFTICSTQIYQTHLHLLLIIQSFNANCKNLLKYTAHIFTQTNQLPSDSYTFSSHLSCPGVITNEQTISFITNYLGTSWKKSNG